MPCHRRHIHSKRACHELVGANIRRLRRKGYSRADAAGIAYGMARDRGCGKYLPRRE